MRRSSHGMRAISATWTISRYEPSRPVIRHAVMSASAKESTPSRGVPRHHSQSVPAAPAAAGATSSAARTWRGCRSGGRRHRCRAVLRAAGTGWRSGPGEAGREGTRGPDLVWRMSVTLTLPFLSAASWNECRYTGCCLRLTRPAHTSSQPPAHMSAAAASSSILLSRPVNGRVPAGRALLAMTVSVPEGCACSASPGTGAEEPASAVVRGGPLVDVTAMTIVCRPAVDVGAAASVGAAVVAGPPALTSSTVVAAGPAAAVVVVVGSAAATVVVVVGPAAAALVVVVVGSAAAAALVVVVGPVGSVTWALTT